MDGNKTSFVFGTCERVCALEHDLSAPVPGKRGVRRGEGEGRGGEARGDD